MRMLRATLVTFLLFAIIGGYFYTMRHLEGWYKTATHTLYEVTR